jgi:hypothetical protein
MMIKIIQLFKDNLLLILNVWFLGVPPFFYLLLVLITFLLKPRYMSEFKYLSIFMWIYLIGGLVICCITPFINYHWARENRLTLLAYFLFYAIAIIAPFVNMLLLKM